MSCEERCEPFEHTFRRPALHLFGGALYAYQMSSDAMPGPSRRQRYHNGRPNEGIMPSETKFSGLMPEFLTEMGPLGPSMGSIERCKTVQKWMWYDPRERNPVEPRTSDVLPTSPRTHIVPGTAGYGHYGEPLQSFGRNPDFTGLIH